MKAIMVILLSMATTVFAGNPDGRSSVEFNLTKNFINYERAIEIPDTTITEKSSAGPIKFDFKFIFPTKENLSLILGGGYIHETLTFDEENVSTSTEYKTNGAFLRFGMKFYFSSTN